MCTLVERGEGGGLSGTAEVYVASAGVRLDSRKRKDGTDGLCVAFTWCLAGGAQRGARQGSQGKGGAEQPAAAKGPPISLPKYYPNRRPPSTNKLVALHPGDRHPRTGMGGAECSLLRGRQHALRGQPEPGAALGRSTSAPAPT